MWWKKVTYHNYFLASATLSIATIIGILLAKGFLPPLVPLYYGRPSGAGQLAPTLFLLIIPGVSILLGSINLFLNMFIKDDLIQKVLAVGSFVISLMAGVTVVKIILLVGFF